MPLSSSTEASVTRLTPESLAPTPAVSRPLADGVGPRPAAGSGEPGQGGEASSRALDRVMVRGIAWTGGARWLTQVVSWAVTLLVARLLSPADYGLVGMATVYIGLAAIVTEFGLGSAIVALRELDDEHLAQLGSLALLIGFVACAISAGVAPLLAMFYGTPALTVVVVILSTLFIVDSLRTIPVAVMTRALRFKHLALLDAGKALVSAAVTLSVALAGHGYWALVLGILVSSVMATIAAVIMSPMRFAYPRLATIRSTLGFGTRLLVARLSWFGYSNADFIVAGRILGQSALGAYTYAWTLATLPGEKLMSMLWRVTPAMFSAAKHDIAGLRRYFLLLTEALALAACPAAIGMAMVAGDFVPLVLGAQWAGAVVPLQLLALYAGFQATTALLPHVLHVTNQVSLDSRTGIAALIVLPPAFYFGGLQWGTAGIAGMWLVVYPFILMPMYRRVLGTLQLSARTYLQSLWPAVHGSVAMVAAVLAMRALAPDGWPRVIHLGLQIMAGAVAYGVVVFYLHRARLRALLDVVRPRMSTTSA